jgi:uncharacterized protein YbjT (DUF2867 family)
MFNGSTGTATSVVTGAFGFSGQEITKRLLARGETVHTLTNHARPESSLYGKVQVYPLEFGSIEHLVAAMVGADVVYNTYWVRFPYGDMTHERAVKNTKQLILAGEAAGVRRIVHVSITNPSLDSRLTYFRGKAEIEDAIRSSELSYAILRPAVLFGTGDILINNIANMLRRLPLFAIPGDGQYRIQPIFVEDLADLAVEHGRGTENCVVDAVGPETYTYRELVRTIAEAIGRNPFLVSARPAAVRTASSLLGRFVKDVVLTDQEIEGLMADLLVSDAKPTGKTSLREWLTSHANMVGRKYASELKRHYRQVKKAS